MPGQMTLEQQFQSGVSHHQAGRLAEAEQIYRQVLAQQPEHAVALHLLGVVLRNKGRLDEAIASYQRAIRLQPEYAEAHYNLGNALVEKRQLDEAIVSYQRAVQLQPDHARAHYNLGNARLETGRHDQAIAAYQSAIRCQPEYADAHYNLGIARQANGQPNEAITAYRQAIRFKPDYVAAHTNLGNALKDIGQLDEAIATYRRAMALNPNLPETYYNLANALKDKKQVDESLAAYGTAIALKPGYTEAHVQLGNALKDMGQLDGAIAAYRQALRLKPDFAEAHGNLAFTLTFHPGYDARMIGEENRRWNQQHAEPLKQFIQPHTNDRNPDRRLRIGYVSPDFRDHVVGRNLLPLLRQHDHGPWEIFCYSNVPRPDALTEQLRQCADVWHSIVGWSDSQAADLIRQDRIDILVDLTLHMANNRLTVFARQPAPVQATFAGYPGSTGLDTIAYRLTDPYLDPPGLNDQFYSETSIRLPDTFWCYDPLGTELAVNTLPAPTAGHITFGCLNNFCKVNEQVLRLWAQVLKTLDRSRLMALCPEGSHRQLLLDMLQREGINSDRIELMAQRPRLQYLELYHRIDVGLDTFPYNGHTTSLDSFWMGVPVITLVGQTVVGRAGLSQLTNLGLKEFIAQTPEQYIQIAADLAADLPRLAELRRTLRGRMQASPLMDAPRFARNVEAAYRQMWRNWCQRRGGSK